MGRIVTLLMGLLALYQRARLFVGRDIWRADLVARSFLRAVWVYPLRVLLIVGRGFWLEHHSLLHASSLTYTTLLSLVPMLAFMLAFLKSLGVQNLLEPFLFDVLSMVSEDTVRILIGYASNIEVSTLGGLGLATLLVTTVLQVGNFEQSLNEIWGVRTARPLLRKIADYASFLALGPIALLMATSINTRLHSPTFLTTWLSMRVVGEAVTLFSTVLSTVLPYIALWLVFAFFYAFLPNTRVRAIPALIGGVIGGTLWQIARRGNSHGLVAPPPPAPAARRSAVERDLRWCGTGAAAWGRGAPLGCPGAQASGRTVVEGWGGESAQGTLVPVAGVDLARVRLEGWPALITHAGEKATRRFLEFFAANIRNPNTRAGPLTHWPGPPRRTAVGSSRGTPTARVRRPPESAACFPAGSAAPRAVAATGRRPCGILHGRVRAR